MERDPEVFSPVIQYLHHNPPRQSPQACSSPASSKCVTRGDCLGGYRGWVKLGPHDFSHGEGASSWWIRLALISSGGGEISFLR